MDFFEIPDDYKPEKPLTAEESDEITNYLKGHPLFLKEIPEDISGNEHLLALQAIKDEEDPEIAAENLNKQANARLKQGPNSPYYLKDAYEKYTQAIKLKCTNSQLNAKLHCNRAAINLKYKNFGKVIEDCQVAIKHSPDYIKAYYRMAKAFIALKRFQECLDLLQNQQDADLIAVRKEAEAAWAKEKALAAKAEESKSHYASQVQAYFKEKKWILGRENEQLPEGVRIQFFEGSISIPILIVYPEFNQFDLIARTHEEQQVAECLVELFQAALPWDAKHEYSMETVEVYLEIEEAVLRRVPKEATISQLAGWKAVNGAIELIVVVNNQFLQHFRQQYKVY